MIFFYKGVCTNGCPDTLNPVCSNNGTQFQNNCFLEKESAALGEGQSLTKLHNGACLGKDNTNYKIPLYFFFFLLIIHTLYILSYESQKENAALDFYCISHLVPGFYLFLLFHRLFYRCYRPWISVKCHIAPFCE